jgi:hypothetical protein
MRHHFRISQLPVRRHCVAGSIFKAIFRWLISFPEYAIKKQQATK